MNFEMIKNVIEIVLLFSLQVAIVTFISYLIFSEYRRWKQSKNFKKRVGLYSEYVYIARDRIGLHVYEDQIPSYDLDSMRYTRYSRSLPDVLCPTIEIDDPPKRVKIIYEVIDYSD